MKKKNPISVAYSLRGGAGAGPHRNRILSVKKGYSRKVKHKKSNRDD